MTDRFLRAVKHVLRHEGGFVDNPADPGGRTKYGISQRSYPDLDIESLTVDQATEIYWRDYWQGWMDLIEDEVLALMVFDFAVNAGPPRAVRTLQEAANVAADGIVGPVTMAAVNHPRDKRLMRKRFLVRILMFYCSLVRQRPPMGQFLHSWLNRAIDNVLTEKT